MEYSELNTLNYQVAQATVELPTAADLAQTPEVQFTPEIIAKAQELGSNPVKIYEYVKNNYFYEPYYGSLKGAAETFAEMAGNDFDQASLLISLLRSANIPAKYQYGTVEIPIERVQKWLGVESATVAGEMLASNGIPVGLIVEGGKISKVQLEHVWVAAWVSYDNYRGQPGSQNKTWIPLDPSFKQVRYTRGPDIKAIVNFNPNAIMNELKSNSTYSESGYYVSNVNENFVQQKLEEYQANLGNYITNNMPNATPQDLVGEFDILYEKFGILPVTLAKTLEELDRYSWCGHSAMMGKRDCPWMDADYVLLRFNDTKRKARNAYRRFVQEGIAMGPQPELTGGGLVRSLGGWSKVQSSQRRGEKTEYDERILGSGDFVTAIFKEAEEKQVRQLKIRRSGLTIQGIIEKECKTARISPQELKSGSRRKVVSGARLRIARRGVDELGLTSAEIARNLGVCTSTITRALESTERDA